MLLSFKITGSGMPIFARGWSVAMLRPRIRHAKISNEGGGVMRSRSYITTDHDQIRRWTQERGGHPAAVKRSRSDHDIGILRIDFPGFTGTQSLEQISWEEFFENFDRQNLAFLYQETTARGLRSNFNKLIKRRSEQNQKPVEDSLSEDSTGAAGAVSNSATAAAAPRRRAGSRRRSKTTD
jgi:hypothetical protein